MPHDSRNQEIRDQTNFKVFGWTVYLIIGKISYNKVNTSTSFFFLQEAGVRRIAVGIGSGIDISELREIASNDRDVLQVHGYQYLFSILENIMTFACEEQYPGKPLAKRKSNCQLRWLKTVFLFLNTNYLMDGYYHTFSFVSLKIVSNKCPIIGQQVVIIFPS